MGYIKKDKKEIFESIVQSSPTNPQESKSDQDIISLIDIIDEKIVGILGAPHPLEITTR